MPTRETKKVLIVVRTYPVPATKGVEVSCTAAITDAGEWIRLFPVPYRFLDQDKRFKKYQWISVDVEKARDKRPESYKIDPDSIKILSAPLPPKQGWKARKNIIFPLLAHCMCCLQKQQKANGFPTLGVFKPKHIDSLEIKAESKEWTAKQRDILYQGHLFVEGPKHKLEKVPYSFRYTFRCDHDDCRSHTMLCTDWEMGESWRKWSQEYGDDWESKFRQKYQDEMISKLDTYFYVGTVHKYKNWIIVGLFYPPKLPAGSTTIGSLF